MPDTGSTSTDLVNPQASAWNASEIPAGWVSLSTSVASVMRRLTLTRGVA